MPAAARVKIEGLREMQQRFDIGRTELLKRIARGCEKSAEDLVSRAQSLAPHDTGNLEGNFGAGDAQIEARRITVEWGVGAISTGDVDADPQPIAPEDVNKDTVPGPSWEGNYAAAMHEGQWLIGGPAGLDAGPFQFRRGEDTMAKKGTVEDASDGEPGGKFIERPMANRPERYGELIAKVVRKGG